MFAGTLIHYNSPALSDLYFVDPQWLYDLLASVVTVDYGSSCVWDRGMYICNRTIFAVEEKNLSTNGKYLLGHALNRNTPYYIL